ncbi:hypothetical protein G0Q93_003507, partial [Salmonella enterica]|nr:hypothetical protein [Salmonella enterica]EEI4519848.1 hypothetical protein [Salmonella enterica]
NLIAQGYITQVIVTSCYFANINFTTLRSLQQVNSLNWDVRKVLERG